MKYCILVIVLLLCSCSDEYFPVLLESKELQDLSPDDNPIII